MRSVRAITSAALLIALAALCAADKRSTFLGYKSKVLPISLFYYDPVLHSATWVTKEIDPGIDWNELVVSWNIQDPICKGFRVQVRPAHETFRSFDLGEWFPPGSPQPRTSVNGQKADSASVSTDTLLLTKPERGVQLVLTADVTEDGILDTRSLEARCRDIPHFLGLSFVNSKVSVDVANARKGAGRVIEVPQKCQMDYPGGDKICSPTALCMLLDYWADKLARSELRKEVPEVVAGVFDKAYDGAGNWPFNTAYAGSFPRMRAYVGRLSAVSELEAWIDAGIPVACSASIFLLEGRPRPKDDPGHLVVLVGFTADGDPVFNDPGRSQVRQTYKRSDFEKAWATSGRTVYFVYPENAAVPRDSRRHWYAG